MIMMTTTTTIIIKKQADMFPEFSWENSHTTLGVAIGQMLTKMSFR